VYGQNILGDHIQLEPGEVDPLTEQTETGLLVDPLTGLQLDKVLELQEPGNTTLVPAPQ
jgi:hypothetical protein